MRTRSIGIVIASVLAVIIVVTMVIAMIWQGFSSPVRPASPSTGATTAQSAPPIAAAGAEDFYAQTIEWTDCDPDAITSKSERAPRDMSSYRCATVTAPLDWDDPRGEQISLSLAVHRSGRDGAPALFYNLGGPGGAAVKSLTHQVGENLGDALVDAYDIVALDPRGVGASTPVVCMTDEQRDRHNAERVAAGEDDPRARIAQMEENTRELAAGCRELSGDLFRHIDTVSAARDFDMVRALLGQESFNYLGYSYGTFLGATYAELFPQSTGRLVLDGALDPSLSVSEVSELQMRGFEASIRHWVEDCQAAAGCPLTGDVDAGVAQVADFLERLGDSPLETSDPDRPLTQNLALTTVIGLMYSTQTYSALTEAMRQAIGDNDGSQMLFLADFLNDRNSDGTYSSTSADALIAINSLDYPPAGTPEEWEAQAKRLKEELRVFGSFAGYSSVGLDQWPAEHAPRAPIAAAGVGPVVVIGTTHDPATPYVMAQSLAEQLESGVLVTNEGWDHTAYSKLANPCVVDAVEGYLVGGRVPEDGLVCSS
ncbi:alpha/beta hydrolase [Actinomyces sp. B33]|uniref:alpha/beta hydrolase n=1 Tax=Actinomyces sp. B33 TaxID=2942131 RepID=UPI0023409417|nr:alpha/beta hydrolase [Actinomyces sp. B33]MDC4232395.1 alpha/beta hydrolase [Actinomyces sp. B33]